MGSDAWKAARGNLGKNVDEAAQSYNARQHLISNVHVPEVQNAGSPKSTQHTAKDAKNALGIRQIKKMKISKQIAIRAA